MKRIILSVCSGLLLTITAPIVFADNLPANTLPMSKILQSLQSKGYNIIKEIEFEHGAYEVEAIGPQGNKLELRVNPQTGEISNDKNNQAKPISMLDAVQKLESAGYHSIYKIESEGNKYEVKALDKNGKKVKLKMNASTGEIKQG
ncbi:Uncharacterized conserved protein [Legionella lansingensis]|uniref:PepSY domain-containing protein n=1 Tax=Legionella lansingensis TaxID=45067 RepID=A0A0W0VS72_9GAMM|nr:PepSY domain-containing protein [Legionella lansingensis]KTD22853.1 hypothetical protein Llan_0970 [Legionella lansingensis]SNV53633.1 Uncharacterized conserved protein [Legionella lansingensis]